MPRRRLQKKKSSILKLKIVFEERELAEEEHSIGVLELGEILKNFKKRIKEDQHASFDQFFFGKDSELSPPFEISSSTEIVLADTGNNTTTNYSDQKKTAPKWVKDLYKKIVQRSHPDKYIGFPVQAIKEKFTRTYINTVQAFEDLDIGTLLLCAHDVEIDISGIEESESFIDDSIKTHTDRIKEINGLMGYQWYHLPDNNRQHFLEVQLRQLGYIFNSEKVEAVISKSRKKRKPGTHPGKMNFVNRHKLK